MKKVLFALVAVLALYGCGKKNNPQSTQGYFFDYKVRMNNKQNEPTIVNGYWGHVKEYKGNFMPDPSAEKPKEPKTRTNRIVFYEADFKSVIEEATIERNGTTFYDMSKISEADIEPKFYIYPNRNGFYQFDTNGRKYIGFIQISKRLLYMNGGIKEFGGLNNQLINFDMRIDYDATF